MQNVKYLSSSLFIMSVTALFMVFSFGVSAATYKSYTLKVAPYYVKDKDGKIEGIGLDFHNELAKRLGMDKPNVATIPGKRIKSLMEGRDNILLYPLVYKPAREEFIDYMYHTHSSSSNFVGYKKEDGLPAYLQKTPFENIPEKLKIGVLRGTIFESMMKDRGMPERNLNSVATTDQNFNLLVNGRIDFVFTSAGAATGVINDPKFKQYAADTEILTPAIKVAQTYAVMNKGFDPDLRAKIFATVDQMNEDGFLRNMLKKFGYVLDEPKHHLTLQK